MKAKEILKNVCVYLGKEDLLLSNIFETDGEDISEQDQQDLNKMLKCLNFIIQEIASDYLPILKEKEICFTNGEIDIYDIDPNIQEIVSIKSKFGKNLKFKYLNNKIICLVTNATITYKVYPNEIGMEDNVESFGGRLSARVIAYGVASEYSYLEMLYDDAAIWENRFKNALLISCRKKGEIKLKKRGWF